MKIEKIFIANDHSGVEVKNFCKKFLQKKGFEVVDLGSNSSQSVDYPDFSHKLAKNITKDSYYGILICGTGIGISMAANRHENIRAALCHDAFTAKFARAHNDANVLCFGARVVGFGIVENMIEIFFNTEFEGGRHQRRVEKI